MAGLFAFIGAGLGEGADVHDAVRRDHEADEAHAAALGRQVVTASPPGLGGVNPSDSTASTRPIRDRQSLPHRAQLARPDLGRTEDRIAPLDPQLPGDAHQRRLSDVLREWYPLPLRRLLDHLVRGVGEADRYTAKWRRLGGRHDPETYAKAQGGGP